jgi:hypothetical protein
MEYYDEVVARAHGIMEQDRQRIELENANNNAIQSDSELSVLASSLFNGMEGIESNQGIESSQGIDVEMGGTSGCQGDGGHGDGSIQSTVFSPRRIRSSKILNRMSP